MVAGKQIPADILIGQGKAVVEVLFQGFVELGNAVEAVDIDGNGVLLPLTQHQIPVHMVQAVGNMLPNLPDQVLLGQHEDIHTGLVIRGGGVVHGDVFNFALAVQLYGQVQLLHAVGNAGFGHDGHIPAAFHMGGDDLGQVDIGDDGRVDHHHQLVLGAGLQKGHGGVEGFQLTTVVVGLGGGIGSQVLQTALFQLQTPFFTGAHMVDEGLIVVAGDDAHMADTDAGQIGKGKVHLAVTAAVGQAGHGAVGGECAQSGVVCENNTHYIHG